jgi:hypothetical protein
MRITIAVISTATMGKGLTIMKDTDWKGACSVNVLEGLVHVGHRNGLGAVPIR